MSLKARVKKLANAKSKQMIVVDSGADNWGETKLKPKQPIDESLIFVPKNGDW